MTADAFEALEARVTELEHQMRNILPAKLDAVSFGLSLVHEDLRAFRGETQERLVAIALRLDRHDERFDAIDTRLDRHGQMLTEILQRLPAEPGG